MYFTEEVRDIVDSGDFERIPGFAEIGDQGVLRDAMVAYLADTEVDDGA
jgi:hypothetical protein